jgi:hypothetical protein
MHKRSYLLFIIGALMLAAGVLYFGSALAAPDPDCRFGITSPHSISGLEGKFAELNACALLNWGERRPSTLPGDVEYVHVIRTKGLPDLSHVSDLVDDYPGAIWAIGNESDTCYFYNETFQQDCTTPETYANRYLAIANRIRSDDPTATLLFGNIVQPTELRLRYLERAWERLVSEAGSESAASDLIDVWSVHSFILNEWVGEWGTGVPEGFDCEYANTGSDLYGKCWDEGPSPPASCTEDTCWDMVHYTSQPFPETHDNSIFNARIEAMRQWMLDHGERDKPLWITEYGSLFPPDDPEGEDLVNTTDADTADFMTGTFDFLRTATDASTGYAADGDRLVQRWFWYSLNEYRDVYGGTLYDPDNSFARTLVGDEWVAYVQDLLPDQSVAADFDGDGDTDVSLYRPSNGRWYVYGASPFFWGLSTDIPIPADYDGDRITEAAVFRPANGRWYVYGESSLAWGLDGDVPVPCDYDGDGDDDIAVFRPANGRWYVRNQFSQTFGKDGDYPLPADYDGDGDCDLAVFRPLNGRWYVYGESPFTWGLSDDIPVAGDYDGDGEAEASVFRPANGRWYVYGYPSQAWGLSNDIPVPGDYDSDGDTDIAVFRPANGRWYIKNQFNRTWGLDGDFPLPARDYNGDADPYN